MLDAFWSSRIGHVNDPITMQDSELMVSAIKQYILNTEYERDSLKAQRDSAMANGSEI